MTNLEKYTNLKNLIKEFKDLRWSITTSAEKLPIRLFKIYGRCDSTEKSLTPEMCQWINAGLHVTEHKFGAEISYCGSYEMGNAVRKIALRHMEEKLSEYAAVAKSEAEACLAEFK